MLVKNEVTDWRRIGQKEIRPGAPVGDPVNDDPSFESLSAEMKKLDSLSRQPVAWDEVIRFGKEILAEKSKDLLVGAYLCYGLFERHGYGGLRDGLSCLEGLVSLHWDSMYPVVSRGRARKNAIEWLTGKLEPAVSSKPPEPADRDASASCLESMTSLEGTLRQKLGDITGFKEIKAVLEERLRRVEAPSKGANGIAKNSDLTTTSTGQPLQMLWKAVDLARGAAAAARKQDSRLAWPHRAVRAMVWLEIDDYPSHVGGKTKIPPPPARSRETYSSLMSKAAWSELLNRSESEIHDLPFWIDLQRFSVTALKNLGSEYSGAMQAAITECDVFLRRLPELVSFEFSDGQPFADDQTRAWISKDVFSQVEQKNQERKEESRTETENDRLTALRHQWGLLTAEGRLREALDAFQRELQSITSQRLQFLARFELAKLCLEAGQVKLAIGQFELLNQTSLLFSLEDWEPHLGREILIQWWRALGQLSRETRPPAPEIVKQAHEVYSRLCRIDVLTAFDVIDSKLH